MSTCPDKPKNSRAIIKAVGDDLVRKRGKLSYYPIRDIQDSVVATGLPIDVTCWALCVFANPLEFKSFHETLGEDCDYFAMRASILPDLASNWTFSWPDLDLSWLDWHERRDVGWLDIIIPDVSIYDSFNDQS